MPKSSAQLDREIAQALARRSTGIDTTTTLDHKERTDADGNVEITLSHPSNRGTSRQRFTSRERALADIRGQIELKQRLAK